MASWAHVPGAGFVPLERDAWMEAHPPGAVEYGAAVARGGEYGDWIRSLRLAFRADGFGAAWVARWANMRTRMFGLPYGDQGLLIARDLYEASGGFPDIPLMEDVALVRALAARPRLMDAEALTSAERFLAEGWIRRGARNLWTLARYRAGVSPERLAASYRRR